MIVILMDLNLLAVFDALYTERQVTRAARRLGVGQPAMSAALGRLRKALGDELFVRTPEGMQPTPKAIRIAPSIAEALSGLRGMLDAEVPFQAGEAERIFTVASTDYTTHILVPGLMRRLRAAAPLVDLRVIGYDKSALAGMIDRGEVDVALGVFPDAPDNLVRTTLFEERFVGVARNQHPSFAWGPLTLAEFLALPHALVTVRRDTVGALDDALASLGLKRRIAVTLPHMLSLPALLRETDLVAAMPRRLVERYGGDDLLIFELPVETKPWNVSMLWSPHARSDNAAGWIRRQIADAAGEQSVMTG